MSLVIIQLKFGDRVILSPILENITETIQEVEKSLNCVKWTDSIFIYNKKESDVKKVVKRNVIQSICSTLVRHR